MIMATDDPLAVAVISAIHDGDVDSLQRLLADHPELATAVIASEKIARGNRPHLAARRDRLARQLPERPQTVVVLVDAGADVNGRFTGPHTETPCTGRRAATTSP